VNYLLSSLVFRTNLFQVFAQGLSKYLLARRGFDDATTSNKKKIGPQCVHVWLTSYTFTRIKLNYREKK